MIVWRVLSWLPLLTAIVLVYYNYNQPWFYAIVFLLLLAQVWSYYVLYCAEREESKQ